MNKYTHAVDRLIRSFGYVLVPSWRYAPNTLEAHLRELFELLGISCVIDVGANTGQYRDFLRYQVEYKGWIVSFEPVKANLETLERKVATDRHWRVFRCGIGAANATAEINVMRDTQFSSLLAPDHTVVQQYKRENEVMYREQITVRRLADVFPELKSEGLPIDHCYLKTDTQGYDLQVLEGAKPILGNVLALQLELSVMAIYQGMPTLAEALAVNRQLGFDATGFFPISRDKHRRLIEVDGVFTRRPA
jgi:FkbM family methyltransferase